jgi:hypothetical protein
MPYDAGATRRVIVIQVLRGRKTFTLRALQAASAPLARLSGIPSCSQLIALRGGLLGCHYDADALRRVIVIRLLRGRKSLTLRYAQGRAESARSAPLARLSGIPSRSWLSLLLVSKFGLILLFCLN